MAGDVNFYVYVANNPFGFVDPLGLDKDQCAGAGGTMKVTQFEISIEETDNVVEIETKRAVFV